MGAAESMQFKGVLELQWTEFVKGMQKAAASVQQLHSAWSTVARDIANSALTVGTAITGVGTAITAAVATMGTNFLAMEENSMIAFNSMLKDATKARDMFESLVKLGKELPGFSTAAMVDAGKSLLNQRFAAEEVIPLLTAVADQTAAMGGGQEVFNRIIKGLSQIKGKGKASAEEITQQLGEMMPAWQYLADFLQTDVATAQKMVTAGQVDANTAIAGMMQGMQKLGGTAKRMGGTFTGLWAGLIDQADIAAAQMFRPMYEAGKVAMDRLQKIMATDRFAALAENLRKQFAGIADAALSWLDAHGEQAVHDLVGAYERFLESAKQIGRAIVEATPRIRAFAASLWGMLKPLVEFVEAHPEVLAALVMWKGAEMMGVTTAIGSLTSALLGTAKAAPAASSALSTMATSAARMATTWRDIPTAISAWAGPAISSIRAVTLAITGPLMSAMAGVANYTMVTLIPSIIGYSLYFIESLKGMISQLAAVRAAGAWSAIPQLMQWWAASAASATRQIIATLTGPLMGSLRGIANYMMVTLIPTIHGYSLFFIERMKQMIVQVTALRLAMVGIAIVGGTMAGLRAMYELLERIEGKIKTTTEHLQEQADMLSKWGEEADKLVQDAEGAQGDGKAEAIQKAIDAQEKLLKKLMEEMMIRDKIGNDLAKEQATLEGRAQAFGRNAMGLVGVEMVDPAAVENEKANEALRRANEAQKKLDELKAQLKGLPVGDSNNAAPLPAGGPVAGMPVGGVAGAANAQAKIDADAAEKRAAMLADQQRDAAGRNFGPGFGQMRNFMDQGATPQEVGQFAGNVEGATPQMAAALANGVAKALATGQYTPQVADALAQQFFGQIEANKAAADAAADSLRQLNSDFDQTKNRLLQQRVEGNLTAAQQQYALGIAQQLQAARQAGTITEEQYLTGQIRLNAMIDQTAQTMQRTEQEANQLATEFGLLADKGLLTQQQLDGFDQKMEALVLATQNGNMSLDQFNASMAELSAEARQAAEDTDRRQQLGKFAHLTDNIKDPAFKRLVEKQLLAMHQQAQGQQVDQFTQNLLRMNGLLPQVAQGFQGMQGQMQDFGAGLMSQFGGGGGRGGFVDIMGGIGTFLNSAQGQIASLSNNIQMEMQRAKLIYSIDNARGLRLMDGVKQMQAQLDALLAPKAQPLVDSGMFLEDPGLVTDGNRPSEMKVDITLPNVSRLTNQDVRTIMLALRDEAKRTGGRLWD